MLCGQPTLILDMFGLWQDWPPQNTSQLLQILSSFSNHYSRYPPDLIVVTKLALWSAVGQPIGCLAQIRTQILADLRNQFGGP